MPTPAENWSAGLWQTTGTSGNSADSTACPRGPVLGPVPVGVRLGPLLGRWVGVGVRAVGRVRWLAGPGLAGCRGGALAVAGGRACACCAVRVPGSGRGCWRSRFGPDSVQIWPGSVETWGRWRPSLARRRAVVRFITYCGGNKYGRLLAVGRFWWRLVALLAVRLAVRRLYV